MGKLKKLFILITALPLLFYTLIIFAVGNSDTSLLTHSLSEYYEIYPSTCTETGQERADCKSCDYYTVRSVPLREHDYQILYTVSPTCTENGYTLYFCSCGDSYKGDEKAAFGHIFSDDVVIDEKATCISAGSKSRHCTRCYERTDITAIDTVPHKKGTVITAATDKNSGEEKTVCIFCTKVYSSRTIDKISAVKLSSDSYTYNGKRKTPDVTVKDSQGNILTENKDYAVKYQSGRKNPGRYSVTVTFTGDYSGKKVLCFSIKPAKVKNFSAIPSTKSVTLSWNRVKKATGYRIYYYSTKEKKYVFLKDTENLTYTVRKIGGSALKYGTDYKFAVKAYKQAGEDKILSSKRSTLTTSTKPGKAQIKKLKYQSGKITVRWEKQSCDGYELVYATNKSFSSAKVKEIKKSTAIKSSIKDVQKAKTYFVKIRAYKIIGGKKLYGFYSSPSVIKV